MASKSWWWVALATLALASGPIAIEWVVLGIAHALLAVRILIARREAAGQRAADLARFKEIRDALRAQ